MIAELSFFYQRGTVGPHQRKNELGLENFFDFFNVCRYMLLRLKFFHSVYLAFCTVKFCRKLVYECCKRLNLSHITNWSDSLLGFLLIKECIGEIMSDS
jgi:hypothetical protein